jgi:hypothetical protein
MTPIEFAHNYEQDKQRAMKMLWSCKTIPQLECAKNYFNLLLKKWEDVLKTNSTIKMLVEVDEYKFYKEFHSMYAEFRFSYL